MGKKENIKSFWQFHIVYFAIDSIYTIENKGNTLILNSN